jgi:hypothetical protein
MQYLKKVKIYNSYIWLCDLMFCNTCILLCDFFMSKALRLGFFLLQTKNLFIFIIFGLSLELESN